MIAQVKLYIAGGIALIILGLSATIWVQGGRIDRLKADKAALTEDVETAVAANKTNDATIKDLKAERDKAGRSCAKRLADKQSLIDGLNKIDTTTGGNNEGSDAHRTDGSLSGAGDALLALLNGMLPGQGGRPDGVCQAGGPAVAGGAALVSGDVLYCLSEVNAKNFLKDWALCRAWANEGVQKIEGMR